MARRVQHRKKHRDSGRHKDSQILHDLKALLEGPAYSTCQGADGGSDRGSWSKSPIGRGELPTGLLAAWLARATPMEPGTAEVMQAKKMLGTDDRPASTLRNDGLSPPAKLTHMKKMLVVETAATSLEVQYSYIGSSSTCSDDDSLPPPPLLPGFRQAQVGEMFCLRDDMCGLVAACCIVILHTDLCMVAGSLGVLLRDGQSAAVWVRNTAMPPPALLPGGAAMPAV